MQDPLNPFQPDGIGPGGLLSNGGGGAVGATRHASFTHPDPPGPPPPYDSVVMGDANAAAGGSGGADGGGGTRDFEIVVADPVKQGEGVSAFVSYKVRRALARRRCGRPR
jgi:hypothetical protein